MSANRQLDLFVALIGDVPFRDEREAMSVPLVALSKNKRTRIEWEGPSGQKVLVTAPEEYGVATIWDYDVLLWAISQINEAVNAGLPVSARIEFHPYNLLRAVGRDTSGKGYAELKAALHRLRATGVAYESPSLKSKRRNLGAFNLLTAFKIEENEEGQAKAAWLELPLWLFEAITEDRDVLAISPKYFDLTSGLIGSSTASPVAMWASKPDGYSPSSTSTDAADQRNPTLSLPATCARPSPATLCLNTA